MPVIKALDTLGGSASNDEINDRVGQIMGLSDEVLSTPAPGRRCRERRVKSARILGRARRSHSYA